MVTRNFTVRHKDNTYELEYDTDDGLEVLKFQLFSLTSIAPDDQKIVSADDDRLIIWNDSDLNSVCHKLRLLSVDEEPSQGAVDFTKSDEELARMLQAGAKARVNFIGLQPESVRNGSASDLFFAQSELHQISLNWTGAWIQPYQPPRTASADAEETGVVAANGCITSVYKDSRIFDRYHNRHGAYNYQESAETEGLLKLEAATKLDPKLESFRSSIPLASGGVYYGLWKGVCQCAIYSVILHGDHIREDWFAAEEEALMLQQYVAGGNTGQQMENRLRPYISQVLMYEDSNRQEAAKKTVPDDELEEKALVALAKEGNSTPSTSEQKHAFLLQLLSWFKKSFSWVNAPPCDFCGGQTVNQGMGVALPCESACGASRVELYRCTICLRETRFPRYNDPLKLLDTRKGRCGEWANCFTLYCRAFGYESRLIMDFTDHVWTECFSTVLGRWMHLDPCEGVYDNPLLYEKGWKKKLNYVIAIARDGVYDVTKRYTKTWPEVLSRRNITTEPQLCSLLDNLTKECRRGMTPELLSILSDRDRIEMGELERSFCSIDDSAISLPGRQSGDKEWRVSRAEVDVNDDRSLSSTSCPVRKCIDEHVSRIYNAFYHAVSQFVDNSISKSRVLEILEAGSSINQLLDSVSLKSLLQEDGTMDIYLAADPVITSLSLPVAVDTIDEILKELKSTSAFDGTLTTKWEDPCGARGSWLIYYSSDQRIHTLQAYQLTSANDAPERDPMDWVLEGSDDGGSSWYILDKQTSITFQNRFERKTFKLGSAARPSNAFRLRFLAVRDAKDNPRLQIGSIDLYEKVPEEQ
ncbi:unnamed protein product [Rhodiola kirilowii]